MVVKQTTQHSTTVTTHHNVSMTKIPDLPEKRIEVVQLEGLVVMKIIQHCRDGLPELVTGQLLGLDCDGTLEVTNCFAFKSCPEDEEEESVQDGPDYQFEMMRCMREMNADHNTVGWYQSSYMGSFVNESIIDTQFIYQENIENSVVIVYDSVKTSVGGLSLRAFRLTEEFLTLYRGGDFSPSKLKSMNISYQDIFEEIPIKIHNNHLAVALLHELDGELNSRQPLNSLDLSTNPFLEKSVELMIEACDGYFSEQGKFQYYQRLVGRQQAQQAAYLQKRKIENAQRLANGEDLLPEEDLSSNSLFKPIAAPSRLDSMLLSSQIDAYHDQIQRFATLGINKLYLADAVHK